MVPNGVTRLRATGEPYAPPVSRPLASVLAALVLAVGCTGDDADDPPTTAAPVRLNEIQVLGTHNSYRAAMDPDVLELVTAFSEPTGLGLDYAHPSLREQLEAQGARQLELDVYADPVGGLYAERRGLALVDRPTASGLDALDAPGFKVLHSADIDFNSTCLTLIACLDEVRAWSQDHPSHIPVMILLEAKQTPTPDPAGLGFVDPPDFDAATFAALDAEIRSVFADDELVRPADRDGATWPALDDVRGRVLFALDNDDLHDRYGGDILFTNATGFVKLNDPAADGERIRSAVAAGNLVRTRADAETMQARRNDPAQRDAALASGAHWVSTDYLVPDTRFSDYAVALPGGGVARCNPVVAPACDATQLRE